MNTLFKNFNHHECLRKLQAGTNNKLQQDSPHIIALFQKYSGSHEHLTPENVTQ